MSFSLNRRLASFYIKCVNVKNVPEVLCGTSRKFPELIEKPYRIIYRVKKDQIDVLAVIHGARLLPDEL
jgi:plasmid stabilization system protein ParE